MADYAVGDVQGCFEPLMRLLNTIQFNPQHDRLLFCGDLVNRGGRSLDVLRWVYAHQHCCESVLGNHDLSMLSKYHKPHKRIRNKEFKVLFSAPDARLMIQWLLSRPLYLDLDDDLIIHAGLYPLWGIEEFKSMADRTTALMQQDPEAFFSSMYGNTPKQWSADLALSDQTRFVINASTRMRFVKTDGALNFSQNGRVTEMKKLKPWFQFDGIKQAEKHLIFGHWSALGLYQDAQVTCLDSGKVWGGQLTAMRLSDRKIFSC